MLGFTEQVDKWIGKVKRNQVYIFKESTKDLINAMQKPTMEGGRMPVITGFLRASLRVSLRGISGRTINVKDKNRTYKWDAEHAYSVIERVEKPTQKISIYYAAAYAEIAESRYGFMRLARQKWPTFVNRNAKLINGSGGRKR